MFRTIAGPRAGVGIKGISRCKPGVQPWARCELAPIFASKSDIGAKKSLTNGCELEILLAVVVYYPRKKHEIPDSVLLSGPSVAFLVRLGGNGRQGPPYPKESENSRDLAGRGGRVSEGSSRRESPI